MFWSFLQEAEEKSICQGEIKRDLRKPFPLRPFPSLKRELWKTKLDSCVWHSLCWSLNVPHCAPHTGVRDYCKIGIHHTWRSRMNCGNLWMGFIIRPYSVIRSLLVSWRCWRWGNAIGLKSMPAGYWVELTRLVDEMHNVKNKQRQHA